MNKTQQAIENAGGSREVAKKLNIHPIAPTKWKQVPPEHTLTLSKLSGISVFDLRPDIFKTKDELLTVIGQKQSVIQKIPELFRSSRRSQR